MKIKIVKYLVPIVAMIFWTIYTLTNSNMVNFNTDEFWAYDIAADLSFTEILKLTHYEGHTVLWYAILKPFTYFSSLFPGIIKYINWVFCFAVLFLFWFFAPINNIVKALIAFSAPFLIVYPTLGRCYGVALFFLMLLALLYRKRLEKPYLYAGILFLATNICINAAIATFILGLFFVYDLLKSNNWDWKCRKVIVPAGIFFLGFVMLYIQWIPLYPPQYISEFGNFIFFKSFFFPKEYPKILKFISFVIYLPMFVLTCYINCAVIKEKRWHLYVFYIINAVFFFYLFIAPGRVYHFYFLFVYFVMLYWLLIENNKEFKTNRLAYNTTTIYLITLCILYNIWTSPTRFWFTNNKIFKKTVEQIKVLIPKNSTICMVLELSQDIVPYLKNDYKLLSQTGEKIPSFEAYKNIYQSSYRQPQSIKLSPNQNDVYFIVSQVYMNMHIVGRYRGLPDSCLLLNDLYYVCKLPIDKKYTSQRKKKAKISKESIVADRIKAFVPNGSKIYIDLKEDKKLLSELRNNFTVKDIKNKYEITDNMYFITRYDYESNNMQCININEMYFLCKPDKSFVSKLRTDSAKK